MSYQNYIKKRIKSGQYRAWLQNKLGILTDPISASDESGRSKPESYYEEMIRRICEFYWEIEKGIRYMDFRIDQREQIQKRFCRRHKIMDPGKLVSEEELKEMYIQTWKDNWSSDGRIKRDQVNAIFNHSLKKKFSDMAYNPHSECEKQDLEKYNSDWRKALVFYSVKNREDMWLMNPSELHNGE
jgi:hypothetical protein